MGVPQIVTISIAPDNYAYLIICENNAAIIDPSDADLILKELLKRKLNLSLILATHHHSDHTDGIKLLKEATKAVVCGGDKRIPYIDKIVDDGEIVAFEDCIIKIISLPGHTRHQVAYYLPDYDILFTGDTLFGAGCGRIFEGSTDQMYHSLMKLADLPEHTLIYFGHEYTLENLEFALVVDSQNTEVKLRYDQVSKQRSQNIFTVPSTIGLEKKTNPFLRTQSKEIRRYLEMIDRSPIAVFEELRNRKNKF